LGEFPKYPDVITFTSSDESVVSITNTVQSGEVTSSIINAVGPGKATITVKALAGNKTKTFDVYVVSDNLKILLTDENSNAIVDGDVIDINSKKSFTYSYTFNESIGKNANVNVVMSNPDLLSIKKYADSVQFSVLKTGITQVTIYPEIGSEKNGVTFTLNITTDPCVEIIADDYEYLSRTKNSQQDSVRIEPIFRSSTGKEITDPISWEITQGADILSMQVADTGKYVMVRPTGTDCGKATIKVKAGKIEKVIEFDILEPVKSIEMSEESGFDILYGNDKEIAITSNYDGAIPEYPDIIELASSDNNIVQVVGQPTVEGNTIKYQIITSGVGKATLTATAKVSNITKNVMVNVVSQNVKLSLKDAFSNQITNGSTIEIRNNKKAEYTYSINEELFVPQDIVIQNTNPDAVAITVINNKITFAAKKVGTAQISVYPNIGTKDNGTSFVINVTEDKCIDIITEEKVYLNREETYSVNAVAIEPTFVSSSGREITDVIEWSLVDGSEYVKMDVATDKKSISILPTGNGSGTAHIQVKAGDIQKTITVEVLEPATSLYVDGKTTIDLMTGTQSQISVVANYANTNAEKYDVIEFSSSDENVVKVTGTSATGNKTVCYITAVGKGEAVITAKATASGIAKTITVYVISEDAKLVLKDESNNNITDGQQIDVRNSKAREFSFAINQQVDDKNNISVEVSDETIASVYKGTGKIQLIAKAEGTVEVSVYPTIGTKLNGVTFTVNVLPYHPCTDIKVEQSKRLDYAKKEITDAAIITPEFISETGDEITDEIKWEVTSGKTLIEMSVANDNKSISVLPTGIGTGKATIKVKAGAVEKNISIELYDSTPQKPEPEKETVTPSDNKNKPIVKPLKAPKTVKWSKCKGAKKKVSLKWKKAANAAGYEIKISTKKKKGYKVVKKINKGKTVKFTVKKLKKKKVYWFKIRAFAKDAKGNVKYGKWSKAKKVKTK
jgi:hypothetical protein